MIWPYPGHARAKMRTALREGDVGVVLGELIFWVGAGALGGLEGVGGTLGYNHSYVLEIIDNSENRF